MTMNFINNILPLPFDISSNPNPQTQPLFCDKIPFFHREWSLSGIGIRHMEPQSVVGSYAYTASDQLHSPYATRSQSWLMLANNGTYLSILLTQDFALGQELDIVFISSLKVVIGDNGGRKSILVNQLPLLFDEIY